MKNCNQCGKCCIKYGGGNLDVSAEELDLWEIFNPEIFKFVKDSKIWFDPIDGTALQKCPFLVLADKTSVSEPDQYTCSIYFNRPQDCRQYPSYIAEMIRDECEMIEITDLENPKKAQQTLARFMSDSWLSNQ